MKVIVGLGNPGIHYQHTRHNIGFRAVDRLAEISRIPIQTRRFKALYGTGWIDSEKVVLAKPMAFMNQSGEAVEKAVHFFSAGIEDLIVIHDDLDLAFGRLRFKQRGGDGGHQGLRSIIERTGGNHFVRLKIGIGRPPRGIDPAEYVLRPFDQMEKLQLDEVLTKAAEALRVMLLEGLQTAMNRYQKKSRTGGG